MLDEGIHRQLQELFASLTGDIELRVEESAHTDQAEMRTLLQGVASTSERLRVTFEPATRAHPRVRILRNGSPTGITFSAIPTGHEFNSLILAIVHADRQDRLLDAGLRARIQALRGPVRVRTFISLTCEVCPDVVQALNQMALIHPDFSHEIVDGAYAEDEIARLGIQGVPSLVIDGKLFHSGRITLTELLEKFEGHFGKEASTVGADLGEYDVAVVGGGPAGASAAIYSARKGLRTAVIAEKIGGQGQETRGIENLISVPYTEGPALSGELAKHMRQYPIECLEHRRVRAIEEANGKKKITLESGETLVAQSVIVTTGAKWRELGVPGEKEYLGRGVAFCPHCDGPFYKGKKVAVIGGGNSGVEAAIDLAGIAREVVVVEFADRLKADQVLLDKLKALSHVSVVVNAKTQEIVGDGQKVTGLRYQRRDTQAVEEIPLDGVFVQIGLLPNSQFLAEIVQRTPMGEIIVDEKGRTSAKGIYAAGDVTTTPYKQIIIAMGEGAKAALAAFEDRMKA